MEGNLFATALYRAVILIRIKGHLFATTLYRARTNDKKSVSSRLGWRVTFLRLGNTLLAEEEINMFMLRMNHRFMEFMLASTTQTPPSRAA